MKSLRLAFVCCRPKAAGFESGPSFIYRCQNLALALHAQGHQVELAHYSKFKPKQPFDIVVFHRPRYSFTFRLFMRWLRNQGTRCVADFDDMVFDPQWASSSPGVVNNQVTLEQTQKNFHRHAKALALFDHATVSTEPLIKDMQQSHELSPTFIPNAVHISWREKEREECAPALKNTQTDTPLITYFPGTRSHDRDFAMLKEPLRDWLADHPEVRLQVTGELADESVLDSFNPEQLIRFPKQDFASYRAHVAKSWINLAPLEQTPFNHRKSALKAIEASYFNAITLASAIPDMQRLTGAGARLVETDSNAWFAKLTEAYEEQSQQPSDLRAKILKHADAHTIATAFIQRVGTHS